MPRYPHVSIVQIHDGPVRQSRAAFAYGMIRRIRHINVSLVIDCHTFGRVKQGVCAGAVQITGLAGGPTDCCNNTTGADFANGTVAGIADVNIAVLVSRDSKWSIEPGIAARPV